MSIKNFIQHQKTLNESAIMEATVSELRMMGEDQDEILDAMAFINKGIGKGSHRVKPPFGTDTLDALEKDSHRDGATYILAVKANKPGTNYVEAVNDYLDDHGFECRLMDGSNYTLAAQEIVELAKALIKEGEEPRSMRKETLRAAKVTSEVELSDLYYSLIEILGEFYAGGLAKFKTQAKSIMLKKYKLYMTDEYGYKMNETKTTNMKHFKLFESFVNEARVDIKLSTSEELEGTVARFRLSSEVINLANVADRNNHMSVRDARVFSDTEIGFESAADRKAAMRFIESSFKQGALSVDDYTIDK